MAKISNFEYLVHLNTLGGRSFVDWTVYPVFPWYTSAATTLVKSLLISVAGS